MIKPSIKSTKQEEDYMKILELMESLWEAKKKRLRIRKGRVGGMGFLLKKDFWDFYQIIICFKKRFLIWKILMKSFWFD